MTTAIQVLGGLLIAGGFMGMMWGVILVLKEAHKEGLLWLIGCMAVPIVMAYFVVTHQERVHAARMAIAKGLVPFVLGIVLVVWLGPPSGKAAGKAEEKAPPVAMAAVVQMPAAPAAPKPVDPAPKAGAPVPAPAPASVPDEAPDAQTMEQNTHQQAILAGCRNEVGLYCNSVKDDAQALRACLSEYSDNIMPACKAALRE